MNDDVIGGFLRAAAAVLFAVGVFVVAEVLYRRRYDRRMKEMKSTANARRA